MNYRVSISAVLHAAILAHFSLVTADADEQALPSISIQNAVNARVLMPDKNAEEFKSADGRLTVRGVWKDCKFQVTKRRSIGFAAVYNTSRKNSFGGYDSKLFKKEDGQLLLEIHVRADVPKAARAVDLSKVVLVDADGNILRPLGLDVARTSKPSSDFTILETGFSLLELKGEKETRFIPVSDTNVRFGTIAYLADVGAQHPLPIRFLFRVPDLQKAFSIKLADRTPKAKDKDK